MQTIEAPYVAWNPMDEGFHAFFLQETGAELNWANCVGHCSILAEAYRRYRTDLDLDHRYGFFRGEVDHPWWGGKPMHRHAWLEDKEGLIYDPSRWCFVAEAPMMAIGKDGQGEYDFGMNDAKWQVKVAMGQDRLPPFNSGTAVETDFPEILELCEGQVCKERIFWIANLPPFHDLLGGHTHKVFKWLADSDRWRMALPMDSRHLVEENEQLTGLKLELKTQSREEVMKDVKVPDPEEEEHLEWYCDGCDVENAAGDDVCYVCGEMRE